MRRFNAFMVVALFLAQFACTKAYDDSEIRSDIKDLNDRVTRLEELCNEYNTNINAIQSLLSAINSRDYIVSVTPVLESRKEVGYTITFANSNPITIYHGIDGTNGSNGSTPEIGVKADTDGLYYWTIDGEWLLTESGDKVCAEGKQGVPGATGPQGEQGITPKLKIESGYWYVSYNNGTSWSQLGQATGDKGDDGDSIFSSVMQDASYVYFTLSNGTGFTIAKSGTIPNSSGNIDIMWSNDATSIQKEVLTTLVNNLVIIKPGTFVMGTDDSDANYYEKPAHSVTLTNGYYMGIYEVTQEEWVAVMGSNPSEFSGPNLPVESVSWNDIVNEFLPELNRLTGLSFRLPTEAEWEFAARGGNKSQGYKYSGSNNVDEVAWYWDNSDPDEDDCHSPQPVGTKLPNELGLYDMSGNVSEWCCDRYSSSYYSSSPSINPIGADRGSSRVLRGSSYTRDFGDCRLSMRGGDDANDKYSNYGFRVAL